MIRQNVSSNIRQLRLQNNMTQEALAETLGYSKKTVSKWELGECSPGVGTLVRIAGVFGVDMNTLFGFSQRIDYRLGIDGGATKTAFVLCGMDGQIVSSCFLDSCNPVDVGMPRAKEVLRNGILSVCKGIPYGKISAYAGLSGGTTGDHREELGRFFASFGFGRCDNGSDIDNAVSVTLEGNDGIAAIMGTGSVVIAVKDGVRHRIGGYGYFFDDGGSGFDIGRRCLKSCLTARDGSGRETVLLRMCEEQLGMSVIESVGLIYQKGKAFIASFSPLVYDAFRRGDAVAGDILNAAMQSAAADLNAAARLFSGERVTAHLVGGQCKDADTFLPLLRKYLNENVSLSVCVKPQYIGALRLAKREGELCHD